MTGQDSFVLPLPQTNFFLHPVLPVYIPTDVDMTAVKAQVAAVRGQRATGGHAGPA